MNVEQLERLRRDIRGMRIILAEDKGGYGDISAALDKLESQVMAELKDRIWSRYLETDH